MALTAFLFIFSKLQDFQRYLWGPLYLIHFLFTFNSISDYLLFGSSMPHLLVNALILISIICSFKSLKLLELQFSYL
jgi:hypothetical protein